MEAQDRLWIQIMGATYYPRGQTTMQTTYSESQLFHLKSGNHKSHCFVGTERESAHKVLSTVARNKALDKEQQLIQAQNSVCLSDYK